MALLEQQNERRTNTVSIILALSPAWLALAWLISKAQWFWSHRPDLSFGWIVLLLSGFLVWDHWEKRPEPIYRLRWPFVLFGITGGALLLLMQAYQAAYGMMPAVLLGLCVGVYAVVAASIHFVFGWKGIRFFAFPILFLAIALPMPSFIQGPVVNGLQHRVAGANVEILNVLGVPAQQVGALIHLPNGTVGVDEACSGIRSLQSTIMATLFIGYLMLKSRVLQAGLLACGVALALAGNLLRSLYLSLTANAKGVEAISAVHDSAGWSIFVFTAAGVGLLAWLFAKAESWARRNAAANLDAAAVHDSAEV